LLRLSMQAIQSRHINCKCIMHLTAHFFKGPFWICVTLVVTIAISGNLANYLIQVGEHNWTYDFHKSEFDNWLY
jgi:hypothetical protein